MAPLVPFSRVATFLASADALKTASAPDGAAARSRRRRLCHSLSFEPRSAQGQTRRFSDVRVPAASR